MDYIQLNLNGEESVRELITAELFAIGIDSVHETDLLLAYIEKHLFNDDFIVKLQALCEKYKYNYTAEALANINWNAEWESSFTPVTIRDYCLIKASFHKVEEEFQHTIEINPKMSFGTGHHETTWLMMDKISQLNIKEKKVLDYGCGTGILAILAEKELAKDIDAIDIDPLCVENTTENLEINACQRISIQLGDLDILQASKKYDLILANINTKVLLSNADLLAEFLVADGDLVLSGILETDKNIVLDRYKTAGFILEEINQRGEWLCIHFTKSTNSL